MYTFLSLIFPSVFSTYKGELKYHRDLGLFKKNNNSFSVNRNLKNNYAVLLCMLEITKTAWVCQAVDGLGKNGLQILRVSKTR